MADKIKVSNHSIRQGLFRILVKNFMNDLGEYTDKNVVSIDEFPENACVNVTLKDGTVIVYSAHLWKDGRDIEKNY